LNLAPFSFCRSASTVGLGLCPVPNTPCLRRLAGRWLLRSVSRTGRACGIEPIERSSARGSAADNG
jgi:hypothetical protein